MASSPRNTARLVGAGVIAGPRLEIFGQLPGGTVGQPFAFTPSTVGGSGAKTFALTGTLPAGLSFNTSTGAITGAPTTAGTTSGLAITVTDTSGTARTNDLRLVIASNVVSPTPDDVQFSERLSKASVSIPGSQSARAVIDELGDVANIIRYVTAVDADWRNAIVRALGTGRPVEIPYREAPYEVNIPASVNAIPVPTNAIIRGKGGRPTIKTIGASGRLFTLTATLNAEISDLIIDGDSASKGGSTSVIQLDGALECKIERVRYFNGRIGVTLTSGASGNEVRNCDFDTLTLQGVVVTGATTTRNTVASNRIHNCTSFGILLDAGAHGNEIAFNGTVSNGLELIGLTYLCHSNRIIGNHAEGTGDNGISISGRRNEVIGNTCNRNANNGIGVYGDNNEVIGNTCMNNGQGGNASNNWSGIRVHPGFGWRGYRNMVLGNTCGDDQAVPTQQWGVRCNGIQYVPWGAGQAVTVANIWRLNGLNIYRAANLGTTGATAPTHTSGTVSDGGIDWLYVSSFELDATPRHNHIGPNRGIGNVQGEETVGQVNAHTAQDKLSLASRTHVNSQADVLLTDAAPEGALTARPGSLALRGVGTGLGLTAYAKTTGSGSAGWSSLALRLSGTTANRPTGLVAGQAGLHYFDTTLGRTIWWSGSAWVDGAGAAA